jgi:hypothetical protein
MNAQRELKEVTSNLHHLVSTKSIAGIYNSPMVSTMSTSFGIPIEQHIRTNTKQVLMIQNLQKPKSSKMAPYPPSNKATLQASSPYDVDRNKMNRLEKKNHQMKRISDQEFKTFVGHSSSQDLASYIPGINMGVEYLDEWKNPYKKRGIPLTKEDLSLPQLKKKTTGQQQQQQQLQPPFYLSFGGNKSKVLPNDRFDV